MTMRLDENGKLLRVWGVFAVVCGMCLSGCETIGKKVDEGDTSLVVYEPTGGEWKEIATANGKYYVKAMEGMGDIASFFVVTSKPGRDGVKNLVEMENSVKNQAGGRYQILEHDYVDGIPVLSYESVRKSEGGGSQLFQSVLKLKPRASSYKYATREVGIFALHPKMPGFMLRVGCARTSYHGQISKGMRRDAEQFIQQFIADNWLEQRYGDDFGY
ncbi:MAG: hypothetical protein P8J87_20305 [Verrucomicrobiales bacterium]|nr:hypothetical protein [Verrucomicrobiales bacterium]